MTLQQNKPARRARTAGLAAALVLISFASPAQDTIERFVFRAAVTAQDAGVTFPIFPVYGRDSFAAALYGRPLPMGSGGVAEGRSIFAARCAACHSLHGSTAPAGHMERCWRYPKTLFNFVKRAMPLGRFDLPASSRPGSLSDDDVYAVVTYLLAEAKIVKPNAILNEIRLAKVVMPNRDGLIPNNCPQLSLYR